MLNCLILQKLGYIRRERPHQQASNLSTFRMGPKHNVATADAVNPNLTEIVYPTTLTGRKRYAGAVQPETMSKADPDQSKHGSSTEGEPRLSRASVGRYSLYLRFVQQLHNEGPRMVSSSQLGEALGITDAQVRKDLAYLGSLGHRGVGYPTQELIEALQSVLGVNRQWLVVLVGVGNLARALLRYNGFRQHGFRIVALFDEDPEKVNDTIEGLQIFPMSHLAEVISRTGAELAILTVPSEVAQEVANSLAAAGIKGILNFAPVVLRLPANTHLVSVDLAVQLEQLASLVHLATSD